MYCGLHFYKSRIFVTFVSAVFTLPVALNLCVTFFTSTQKLNVLIAITAVIIIITNIQGKESEPNMHATHITLPAPWFFNVNVIWVAC
jgi:hypothetical protein